MVAFTPVSKYEAQQSMCVLMPEVASIEEVVLILNPIYNTFIEAA